MAHPFKLLGLEKVHAQTVELDLEGITTPFDDLTHTAGDGPAAVDHSDSRTGSQGSHHTYRRLTVTGVTRTPRSSWCAGDGEAVDGSGAQIGS